MTYLRGPRKFTSNYVLLYLPKKEALELIGSGVEWRIGLSFLFDARGRGFSFRQRLVCFPKNKLVLLIRLYLCSFEKWVFGRFSDPIGQQIYLKNGVNSSKIKLCKTEIQKAFCQAGMVLWCILHCNWLNMMVTTITCFQNFVFNCFLFWRLLTVRFLIIVIVNILPNYSIINLTHKILGERNIYQWSISLIKMNNKPVRVVSMIDLLLPEFELDMVILATFTRMFSSHVRFCLEIGFSKIKR